MTEIKAESNHESTDEFKYAGSELDLFAEVHNWKAYWSSQVRPFVSGSVLEVGAGIGSNTRFLDPGDAGRWVCLEPDPQLLNQLEHTLESQGAKGSYEAACGTTGSIESEKFDTAVYIDVLEHIEHDADELNAASALLRPGGNLIVLSPAHQNLYTPFDAAIGHFRRYNKASLTAVSPHGMKLIQMRYLDCAGMFLSLANRLLLKQSMPTKAQLHFWDSFVIPVSRVLDGLLFYSVGKTIIAVWQKPD
jgi:ubiquinone/menaquinone biosynthesis C-methylase UbiE